MGRSIYQKFLYLFFLLFVLIAPYFVFAQSMKQGLDDLAGTAHYDTSGGKEKIADVAGTAVSALFSLLGIIFTGLMLYAGYNWMTAAGDEGKTTTAKDTIRRAIIGLVITVGSWAIYQFVAKSLFF